MAWFIYSHSPFTKPALLALKDYEKQRKAGKDPVFNPEDIGVSNAHIWNTIGKKKEE
jgi:AGCS family alanine or glycine:cation symporter